ncbi:MAG: hypothetical protein NTU88_08465 [Armatimonadetes bacterium]|nr:hypothetical protein [Armatimonadota bacterium]
MRKSIILAVIVFFLIVLVQAAVYADLEVTFQTDTFTGLPGQSYTFWGTVRNAGLSPVNVGAVQIWFIPHELHMTCGDYFLDYAARVYEPGDSYTGPLLDVTIVEYLQSPWVTHFAVNWLPVDGEPPYLRAINDFTVNVVPEPASILALSCGFSGLLYLSGRRRRGK